MRYFLLFLNIILLCLGLASCNTVDPLFVVFSLNNPVLFISMIILNIIFFGITFLENGAGRSWQIFFAVIGFLPVILSLPFYLGEFPATTNVAYVAFLSAILAITDLHNAVICTLMISFLPPKAEMCHITIESTN